MSFYRRIIIVFILGITLDSLESIQAQKLCDGFTVELIECSPKSVGTTSSHWDENSNSLYYCDLFRNDSCVIMRYSCDEDRVYCATVEDVEFVVFIIPIEGAHDRFVVGSNKTVEEIKWDGKSPKAKRIRTLFEAENCTEFEINTFSFGKADPYGRLFCGTRRGDVCRGLDTIPTYGNLFRLSADKPPVTVIKPKTIRFTNGITVDAKKNKFHLIDSCAFNIQSFDYCPHTGDISNPRVLYNYTDGGQSPSNFIKAVEIDRKGNLFIGSLGSGAIIKICPRTGKEICRIPFPCPQVSAMSFAGKNLDEMIVATASNPRLLPQNPTCGYLYKVRGFSVGGLNPNRVRI